MGRLSESWGARPFSALADSRGQPFLWSACIASSLAKVLSLSPLLYLLFAKLAKNTQTWKLANLLLQKSLFAVNKVESLLNFWMVRVLLGQRKALCTPLYRHVQCKLYSLAEYISTVYFIEKWPYKSHSFAVNKSKLYQQQGVEKLFLFFCDALSFLYRACRTMQKSECVH